MKISKERQGEIALSVVRTLMARYGNMIKMKELIHLIASAPEVTADEAGIFLGTIAVHPGSAHDLTERAAHDRRKS